MLFGAVAVDHRGRWEFERVAFLLRSFARLIFSYRFALGVCVPLPGTTRDLGCSSFKSGQDAPLIAAVNYTKIERSLAGSMTFEDVIGMYMSSVSHRSGQRDRYSLQRLQPHFGGMRIADLKRADVRAYVTLRMVDGVKPSTVNRELKLLSAAINYVRLEHDRSDLANPAERLGIGEGEGRVRWITDGEASALCEAAGRHARRPHLAIFIRLAINTGCRKSELIKLEWSRVSLDRRLLMLGAQHTKSGRRRTVPLNDAALEALRELQAWRNRHAPGNPWVFATKAGERITTFQKGFAAACRRAGIVDFRIHDMRHTCASWLVMAGTPLEVVRDLLGHSSVTVTERYAHLAPEQLRGAVQRLLPF